MVDERNRLVSISTLGNRKRGSLRFEKRGSLKKRG